MNNKIDETFLKTQKDCLSEYIGTELSLKRGKPASEQMCSEYQNQIKMNRLFIYAKEKEN